MRATFTDRATVADLRRTGDGYLVADVRVARIGIQSYRGAELGRPELASVRVYRPLEAVFAADAMGSAAHKPITIGHPADSVDAKTWRREAVGWTGETVARDGAFLRVPLMLADADAVATVEGGVRELSCGYSCDVDWTAGTTPEGEAYDARQSAIRINHVAIVAKGRAGAECRIGDSGQAHDALAARDAAYAARNQRYATGYLGDAKPADAAPPRTSATIATVSAIADAAEVSRLRAELVTLQYLRRVRYATAHQGRAA